MAKREGFVVSRTRAADSPVSPNAVVPAVTVEVRVHWPARMGHEEAVVAELEAAVVEARAAIAARTQPPTERTRAAEQAADDERVAERRRLWRARQDEQRAADAKYEADTAAVLETRH